MTRHRGRLVREWRGGPREHQRTMKATPKTMPKGGMKPMPTPAKKGKMPMYNEKAEDRAEKKKGKKC